MTITSTFYKEIYFVDETEKLGHKQWNNLLMSGEENWDKYFLPFKTKREKEIIKNVEMLEFNSEDEMFEYIKNINPIFMINFSLQHEKPCLLKFI